MKRNLLFLTLLESANTHFSGWDFFFYFRNGPNEERAFIMVVR